MAREQVGVALEEDGHGDQDVTGAIGVPSVEPAGETSSSLTVKKEVKIEEFEDMMSEAKKYNEVARVIKSKENPPQEALHTERRPEVKVNPSQGARRTTRSPEVKKEL